MPLRQHLPSRPGSHQQAGSCCLQAPTLRHLSTISPAKVGRCARLMIALIVPGLLIWSLGIADVSLVPGRACANTWYSSESCGIPDASISEMRTYWLPIAPLMLAQAGLAGSFGGFSGSKAIWQDPQLVPIRNGGSIAPSASMRTRASAEVGTFESCLL